MKVLFKAGILIIALGFMAELAARCDDRPANSTLSRDELMSVGIEQRLGQQVPPGLVFTDSTGREVKLDSLLARKPTLLVLAYYECPNLCTLVLNGMVSSVADLRRDVGNGFQIVVVITC